MIRQAVDADVPQLTAFLSRHAETSMFLLGNLAAHGVSGSDSPQATTFWLAGDPIRAVFGLSRGGMGLCQARNASDREWAAFAQAISGQSFAGLSGDASQVARAKTALGIVGAQYALDQPEPLYRLSLDDLILPEAPGEIRALRESDRSLLESWFAAYVEELRMSTPERRDAEARARADRAISGNAVRWLMVDGQPVAMTAFNARLPDMVQVGGVYTPPELRGRGYARNAVALHLDEVRREGVSTAILFASGPAACRAYEAIGFLHIGSYALAILKEPVVIGA